ncbi:MAG: transglutaminase family protein [Anaerolineae bacterium]|nr:transglutaminase family protein [Anaerolineae bacterium]
MRLSEDFRPYLQPTYFIDSDSPPVVEFAQTAAANGQTDIEKAVKLYYAVRDQIRYRVYDLVFEPYKFKASIVLVEKVSFCIPKAALLAAAARVLNIPSQLGFADVRNHLSSGRLLDIMWTDVFIYHGYTELFLAGRWVKATPAFNCHCARNSGCCRWSLTGGATPSSTPSTPRASTTWNTCAITATLPTCLLSR